ncbi:unnamed protein product [Acanthoscelides obtectus]|uniref:Peptidase metallopeptidase domain-containing protein n=1 Tax=Acanthoscelides obtectus TaxID=200917 RepID=A0A9P0PG78_ACAOB|nr:unnamed protein product [Acanthoscelides obtectus]CAK1634400.1 Putative metalloproteinase 165R [Acanthoscelides obtectus]
MVTNPTLYPPDITITMVSKTHYFSANCMGNDECPLTLDDAGGVLGHAYFPDSSGTCREIHLDINERWYFGNNPNIPKNQTSFLMVLVHEIGHALGIAHSASPNAIMFAFYQHEIRGLDVDDINAVQYLYGRKNKYDSIPKSTTASAIPKTTTTIRSTTPTRLGDQCYYMETCKYTDQHASCIQVHHHAVCQCENGYHSVSIDRPSKKVFCAEVPRADPVIDQGMKCQRFGEETWNKIRYVDAQKKKLHASPVFSTLKVNSSLYNNGHASPMTDMLSKSDLAFGTISHGLLKQRRIIHEALKEAGNKHPEAADTLKKVFAANSEYKTISDDLLQFVCGKRAEIIESRRKLYEPKSSYYRSIVNEIPPSGTHLWDEEQLKDVVKMHGVTKIAPVRWQSNLGKVALRQKVPQGTSHEKRTKARGIHPDRYSHKAGFLHQPGEVRNKTYTEIGISRYYVEHHKKSKEFTGGQNPPSANINPSWNQEQDLELEAGKGTARENGICLVCYPIGSTTLQKDTKSSQSDVRKPTKETVQYRPGSIARAKMVGEKLKRVIHNLHERTGSSYNNRCLKHGLGSPSRRHFEERKLDRAAGKVAYQQKRNVRDLLSAKKPPRSIGKQNTVNSDGQQDGGFLLEKSRRNQVGHAFGIDQEDPGAGTSIQYVSENRTYSRKLQYCDRPPIQRKGSARLALIKDSSEEDLRKVGNPLHRPIYDSRISRHVAVMTSDFSTFAGVLSGIAILSGLICFVLHLFNQNLYETRHHRHRFGNANLAPPILFSSDPGELRSLCFLASFYVLCQLGVSLSQNSLLIK